MVDCQQLHLYLLLLILFAPQGDTFQQGTEVHEYVIRSDESEAPNNKADLQFEYATTGTTP